MSEQVTKSAEANFSIGKEDMDLLPRISMTEGGVWVDGVEAQYVIAERIVGAQADEVVFINGNPFDLKRSNLVVKERPRLCEASTEQPRADEEPKGQEAKFTPRWKGYDRRLNADGSYRYYARIYHNNTGHNIGSYKEEEEAAIAYDLARRQLFGKKACVNFPKSRYLQELKEFDLRSWMEQKATFYGNLEKKSKLGLKKETMRVVSQEKPPETLPFASTEPQPAPRQATVVSQAVPGQQLRYFISAMDMAKELGISHGYLKMYIKEGIIPAPTPNSMGLDYYDVEGQRACFECKATGKGVNGLPFVPRPPRLRKT